MAVLLNAGAQLPVIPSMDVTGNIGASAPLQMEGIAEKVGVMLELTVTASVAFVIHPLAEGIKV